MSGEDFVPGSASSRGLDRLRGLGSEFLGKVPRVHGMFQRLLAEFVSGQVITLGVSCGCGDMGVGGKFVQLCDSIQCCLGPVGLLYVAGSHRECNGGRTIRQAANGARGLSIPWNQL